MIALRLRNRMERLRDALDSRSEPILQPYYPARSRRDVTVRRALLMAICVLLGLTYGFLSTILPPFLLMYMLMPVGVMIMVIIWALPETRNPPVRALKGLFYTLVVLIGFWPDYLALAIPGMPAVSFRRIAGVAIALTLLVSISMSSRVRREIADALKALPPVWMMLIGLVMIQVVTLAISKEPIGSLNAVINAQLFWTTVFFVSVYVFIKPGEITRWINLICALALALCVMGLAEWQVQHILWSEHIPPFLTSASESIQRTLTPTFRDGRYRVTTIFSTSLSTAEYLALVAPLALHKFITSATLRAKAFWLGFDLLLLFTINNTGARLGLVGFMVGHAVYGLVWTVRRYQLQPKSDLIAPAVLAAYPILLGLFLTALFTVDALKMRILTPGSTGMSDDARQVQSDMTWPIVMKNPIGHGAGEAAQTLGFTTPGGQLTVDSYVLTLALDYGVFGLIFYFGMMIVAGYRTGLVAISTRDGELANAILIPSILAVWISSKTVLSQNDTDSVVFMVLGMATAIVFRHGRAEGGVGAPAATPRQ